MADNTVKVFLHQVCIDLVNVLQFNRLDPLALILIENIIGGYFFDCSTVGVGSSFTVMHSKKY